MQNKKQNIFRGSRSDTTRHLVRLGSPDRLRPSDILCCAEVATTTTAILDVCILIFRFVG
jgi:hypothetical protein